MTLISESYQNYKNVAVSNQHDFWKGGAKGRGMFGWYTVKKGYRFIIPGQREFG
jgi:hypothetical protein